ncbi:MAG TPA: response regulator [Herpetosiphonaceae bacterium]|jgi:CheY-like chemotaxis protein|nr:response regulator [Herpetosiphonaceae bacterium]
MPLRNPAPQGTRILVVDDQPELAELIRTVLGEEGYIVSICTSGREAMRMIEQEMPSALILDVMMPETDGFEVLRQLRTNPVGQRLPVILMSGAWRRSEKSRQIGTTMEVAPTIVLPKPFELVDLDRCLRQLGITPTAVS